MQNSNTKDWGIDIAGYDRVFVDEKADVPQSVHDFIKEMFADDAIKMNMPEDMVQMFRAYPDMYLPTAFKMGASFQFVKPSNTDNIVGYISMLPTTLDKFFVEKFPEANPDQMIHFLGAFMSQEFRHKGIVKEYLKALSEACDAGKFKDQTFCIGYRVENETMKDLAAKYLTGWKKLGESAIAGQDSSEKLVVNVR